MLEALWNVAQIIIVVLGVISLDYWINRIGDKLEDKKLSRSAK
jgi:hypothetical protein